MTSLNFNYYPKRFCAGCVKNTYRVLEVYPKDELYSNCRFFGSCNGCGAWEISHDSGCFTVHSCSENSSRRRNIEPNQKVFVTNSKLLDMQENQQCPVCMSMFAVIVLDNNTTFEGDQKYIFCQKCRHKDIQKAPFVYIPPEFCTEKVFQKALGM